MGEADSVRKCNYFRQEKTTFATSMNRLIQGCKLVKFNSGFTKLKSTQHTQIKNVMTPMRKLSTGTSNGSGFSYPAPRALDAVVNIDLLSKEAPENIARIWTEFHAASAASMASVVSKNDYSKMQQRATSTPFYVLPVAREAGGYFNLIAQYQGNSWLLTYLEDFRNNPSSALPYLCLTAYKELEVSKGLVLLRADICALATLNKEDASKILAQIAAFYADDGLYKHVFSFNKTPREFDFEASRLAADSIHEYQSPDLFK